MRASRHPRFQEKRSWKTLVIKYFEPNSTSDTCQPGLIYDPTEPGAGCWFVSVQFWPLSSNQWRHRKPGILFFLAIGISTSFQRWTTRQHFWWVRRSVLSCLVEQSEVASCSEYEINLSYLLPSNCATDDSYVFQSLHFWSDLKEKMHMAFLR